MGISEADGGSRIRERRFGSMAFTIVLHRLWSAGGLDDISLTKAWRLSLLDISILWLLAAAD